LAGHLVNEGIAMIEIRPTTLNFSEPLKEIEAAVRDRRFHHNGDPVLSWMVSNVVIRRDQKDNIYPTKEFQEKKIDGVVALCMAMNRAMGRLAEGTGGTSVYEEIARRRKAAAEMRS